MRRPHAPGDAAPSRVGAESKRNRRPRVRGPASRHDEHARPVDDGGRWSYVPMMAKDVSLERAHAIADRFVRPFRVTKGKRFRLEDFDPGDTRGLDYGKKRGEAQLLEQGTALLRELQEQALRAGSLGRADRASRRWMRPARTARIEHVMSGVNPQGCQVHPFKAPSAEELDHDFLWRCVRRLPERGRIGIFNRSYYEEVLVVRVHRRAARARRSCPPSLVDEGASGRSATRTSTPSSATWRATATSSSSSSCTSRKEEQRQRFLERLDEPEKNWKFSAADVARARALATTTWTPTRT